MFYNSEAPNAPVEQLLSRNKAVFDWCLRSARRAEAANQLEAMAEWCHLAAFSAGYNGFFGALTSTDLEDTLGRLSLQMPNRMPRRKNSRGMNWLHIMTTAFGVGGHTNALCRWIRMGGGVCHHVAITDQYCLLPEKLKQAVAANGGELRVLERGTSLIRQAQELWSMAASLADVVVLHIHPQDVSAIIAFARPSEIPVCLMNHMDHNFWVGASASDLVIEFRDLGRLWTRRFRGVERSAMLPLPLEEPVWDPWREPGQTIVARERLGISREQTMLLTIGTAYKYESAGKWDFLCAVGNILDACPDAVLVAVGPDPVGRWKTAAEKYGGRLRAIGSKTDISYGNSDYYLAADIALGSFPFASQTAILECAWRGIPCVLTPKAIPFGLDDPALEGMEWPVTQQDFVNAAIRLIHDPELRRERGARLAGAVARHHCGKGWLDYWDKLQGAIPPTHKLYKIAPHVSLDLDACAFWSGLNKLAGTDALDHVHGRIISGNFHVTPYHDEELRASLHSGSCRRSFPSLRFKWRKARFELGKWRRKMFVRN